MSETETTTSETCADGFPLALSPMGWAKVCKAGDDYDYVTRGMAPVLGAELDALCEVCDERGLELFGGDSGLYVQSNGAAEAHLTECVDDASELRHNAREQLAATLHKAEDCETIAQLDLCLAEAESEARWLLDSIKRLRKTAKGGVK